MYGNDIIIQSKYSIFQWNLMSNFHILELKII